MSGATGWSRGGFMGPRPQQLRQRPSRAITGRVPQEGHLPTACQRVTGAGLEFASGPTQAIE